MTFRMRTNETPSDVKYINFGGLDRFGRVMGAKIVTYECDFVNAPPEAYSGYTIAEGHYYAMLPSATRNEVPYGASQLTRYFKTEKDRSEAFAKYIKGASKRALKREGK